MIHVLNNLPEDFNVILDGLENHLMMTGDDALTINVICKKFNHWYKKTKSKKKEKSRKEKALGAYNKQYKQRCHKCGKYIHKPDNQKCPENKNEKQEKKRKQKRVKKKIKIGWYMLLLEEKRAFELGLYRERI